MRLERLSIGGFGRLPAGRELIFTPGLNLVLAPNERGKTTLSQLIAGLFYGFGPRRGGAHPFEPWSGGDTGGDLVYRLDSGQTFTLGRHLDKRENLTLRDEAGREVALGGEQPGELHLGLGQGAFLTVSRIGLDDLQQALYAGGGGKELDTTRQWLAGYFFSEAATRGEVANPVSVRQAWAEKRERLYADDRRKGADSKGLAQRTAQAQEALAAASQREEQARQTRHELEALAAQAEGLDDQRRAAVQAVQAAGKRLEQAQSLARRDGLLAQIEALGKQGLATEQDEAKARDLVGQAQAARERAQAAQAEAEQARAKAADLAPGGDPQRLEASLRGLQEMRAELNAAHRMQEASESGLTRRANSLREQWGLDSAALAAVDGQLPHRVERLRGQAKDAGQAADDAKRAQEALPEPPPTPVWWLGLVFIALVGGGKLMAWAYFALVPWWFWALGGGLAASGLGLAGFWLWRRKQSKLAHQRLGEAQAALEQAKQKQEAADQELSQAAEGLPPVLRQAEALALTQALAEARRLEGEREAQAHDRAALEEKREALLAQARDLAPQAGGGMEGALEDTRRRAQQAQEALAHARRQQEQAQREDDAALALEQGLAGHLAALGLADLPALAQARERSRQAGKLHAAAAEIEQGLGEAANQAPGQEAAQGALTHAQEALAALDREIRALAGRRGELAKELEHLGRSEPAAQAQARLDALTQERAALARRHDALLLAEALLGRAMEEFRLEAQPGLLKKAGRYLAMATDGAYEWLGTDLFAAGAPAKGEPEIKARSGPGAPERDSGALSRGTRDQLYLCLRLALAQEITAQGEPLPLILDDPLVNFDAQRLGASLGMLCQLATERQVLLLTCHPHQAELLEQRCAVNRLEI
ncbi:MAG: AAA family ATPase [Proteobacteria bacterium]|nr:AAA family ATPase [Pseudomonadota bacterium]MBU1450121.1 AAA family ATPase [Pseudomonadota bacterium]MBU2468334.1 AAA family ATPase [Pseudomonadota bacterium]MBU2515979.1 AAA family ATPase [Pseudomonadota bacterium]